MKHLRFEALFRNMSDSPILPYTALFNYPWELLPHLKSIITKIGAELPEEEYYSPSEGVYISVNATVHPSATILAPTVIMSGTELRTGAFIRGGVLVGRDCVIGNSCEIKNSVILDGAQIPHFNYVGDSIIGYRAHLGAGAVTSNVKSDKTEVTVLNFGNKTPTGLRKMGALVGDYAEIGCGCVLNPGTVIGRRTTVYPLSCVRGYVEENSIYKSQKTIVRKQ